MGEGLERKGDGGLEWGGWVELTGKNEKLSAKVVPFFCDVGQSSVEVRHLL
jgi:hypothetical protein